VGSQGDGSVQVLCDPHEQQQQVLTLLADLGCTGFPLTLPASASPKSQSDAENAAVQLLPQLHTQHVRCALVMATAPQDSPEDMEALRPQLLQLLACGISKCSVVCPGTSTSSTIFSATSDTSPRAGADAPVSEAEPVTTDDMNQDFSCNKYQKALLEESVRFFFHAAGDATARQYSTVQALENLDLPESKGGSGNVLLIKEESLSTGFAALMKNLDTTHSTSSKGSSSPRPAPAEPGSDDACIVGMSELKTELLEVLMQREVKLRVR